MIPKTRQILDRFEQINSIPRCSGKEDKLLQWLVHWAEENQFLYKKDSAGNMVVKLAATQGYEVRPGIVLQGHLDMVCEKTPDAIHDFSKDPIRMIYDGDWLRADNTTLGADNGIAIAIGMVVAEDESLEHPAIELLFTVDEESGLNGAKKIEPGFIEGRILLNLDSETEGVFTVGCAGGRHTLIRAELEFESLPDNYQICEISVHGLCGGHSGIDIIRRRANANKILARVLHCLQTNHDIKLITIAGGTAHNAIPRDAAAVIACDPAHCNALRQDIVEFEQIIRVEYEATEKHLAISFLADKKGQRPQWMLTTPEAERLVNLLLALPHGIQHMSSLFEGIVETSNNLATMGIQDKTLHILTSQRSSSLSRMDEISNAIKSIASLCNAQTLCTSEYPPWHPDLNASLLQRCIDIHKNLFTQDAVVTAIHAGLECAIIGSKFPGMDMISFGPTIENPHSPDERLYIPSIDRTWQLLINVLKSFENGEGLI
jgi:dipeptidase D